MIKKLAIIAALLTAGSAQAATVIGFTPGAVNALPGETLVANFELNNGGITGSGYDFFTGTYSNAATPAGNSSRYLAVFSGGAATFTFASAINAFSLNIGSLDDYNKVTLNFLGGGSESIGGSSLGATANGNQGSSASNGRFSFTQNDSKLVQSVTFSSTGNSFELDNIAVKNAVPEPATWAMMLTGFGLVGGAMRRRSSGPAVAAA